MHIWGLKLLPCFFSCLARWPALGRKSTARSKRSSDNETRWVSHILELGATSWRERQLPPGLDVSSPGFEKG